MAAPAAPSGPTRAPSNRTGSCFGFRVVSEEPLYYLRSEAADADLLTVSVGDVRQPRTSDPIVLNMHAEVPGVPREEWPITSQAYATDDPGRYLVQCWGGGWYDVDAVQNRVVMPAGEEPITREEKLWGLPSRLLLLGRGLLALHAAAVEISGRAVVLLAPSRFGKTTLALALARAGHRLLSEDAVAIDIRDGVHGVLPGPTMLRLRPDVAAAVTLSGAHVTAADDDRVHLAVPDGARDGAHAVPIAAIVLLRMSDNGLSVEDVEPEPAMRDVFSHALWLQTTESRALAFTLVADLLGTTRVIDLARPLRFDELDQVVAAVEALAADE